MNSKTSKKTMKSTNDLNEEMRCHVLAAQKLAAEAAERIQLANALLQQIKGRGVAVREYLYPERPEGGTVEVMAYLPNGESLLNLGSK
jgi:hypothetical protein